METLQEIREFINLGYKEYRPNLTIDCAIFGYHEGKLYILLIKNKIITKWCLPGGYVKLTENLDEAATRITDERTGINNLFLMQFKSFGEPGRNQSLGTFDEKLFYDMTGVNISADCWLAGETVTIGYYAITDISKTKPNTDFLSSECRWFPLKELPKLGFDHDNLVSEALFSMRIHLYHFPIGKNLLQKKFTLKEIKLLYEAISGKSLNATNFPNKLISLGLLIKLNEKKKIGAHRSPAYYKFNEKKYNEALKEGLVLA